MNEEWKDIPGYEGLYEASSFGRIRTKDGKTTSNARFPVRVWKQRILKTKVEQRKKSLLSDERVNLWKDGINKTCLVSRLVAMTWVDGYKEGLTVNHKDGNPMNNIPNNLEWISHGDNIRHGFSHGLYNANCKKCKLIDIDGKEMIFNSISQTCKYLQRSKDYIVKRIHGNCSDNSVFAKDGTKYFINLF